MTFIRPFAVVACLPSKFSKLNFPNMYLVALSVTNYLFKFFDVNEIVGRFIDFKNWLLGSDLTWFFWFLVFILLISICFITYSL